MYVDPPSGSNTAPQDANLAVGLSEIVDPDFNFHPGEKIQASVADVVTLEGSPVEPYVWSFRARANDAPANFQTRQNLSMSRWFNVNLSDIDGDGDLDGISKLGYGDLTLHVNDESDLSEFGLFIEASHNADFVRDISVGDLNLDGKIDLFLCCTEGIRPYLNIGSGIF